MDQLTIENELMHIAKLRLERFAQLVTLAEEQREILVHARNSDLPANVAEHDRLLVELGKLESKEDKIKAILSNGSAGASPSQASPSQWTPNAELEQAITDVNIRAVELALMFQQLTYTNKELLDNAMEYINFTLAVISKLACEDQSNACGSEMTNTHAILLDRKV